MDRNFLLFLVVGVSVLNGLLSPYIAIAMPIAAVLMPEVFPRSVGWVLFYSSILVSSATLLVSGVPAALYERFIDRGRGGIATMAIWMAGAVLLSLPALRHMMALGSGVKIQP
jgi:hypothetical protein